MVIPIEKIATKNQTYQHREGYGLSSGPEHPARLDFTLVSLVVDYKF